MHKKRFQTESFFLAKLTTWFFILKFERIYADLSASENSGSLADDPDIICRNADMFMITGE